MNPDQLDLARRLAARTQFKQLMFYREDGGKAVAASDHESGLGRGVPLLQDHNHKLGQPPSSDWIPDLTDAATGGVLLDMLRPGYLEYFPEEHIWLTRKKPAPDAPYHAGKALAEACARALLAEWGDA